MRSRFHFFGRGRSMKTRLRFLLLASLICCPFLNGQAITGDLTINVTDPNGATVSSAILQLKNTQEGTVTQGRTNDLGTYSFSQLKPGSYSLKVAAPGFQDQLVNDITIQLAQRASVQRQAHAWNREPDR